jgi:hypothetical protein
MKLADANRNDVTQLVPLVDSLPAVRRPPGATCGSPAAWWTTAASTRRGTGCGCRAGRRDRPPHHGSGLKFKRLRVRDDGDDALGEAFMTIACATISWRRLHS